MKLALGTVQFGLNYGIANKNGQVPYQEAKAILQQAQSSGIDTLDTAIIYGESENRLGEIGVQEWKVVSKLPPIPKGCADISQWMTVTVKDSLKRLKVNSLYGILLHRPQQLLENDGENLYKALQKLKDDGWAKKIGISIYDPQELHALCNRYNFDLVQTPFNILDHRMVDTGWIYRLAQMETELHVRSVFLQGLLLMNENERPKKFDRWFPLWSQYTEWLNKNRLTPLQACLRYALSVPEISRVIVGVDSLQQLVQILGSATGPAPPISDLIKTDDPDLLNPSHWDVLKRV